MSEILGARVVREEKRETVESGAKRAPAGRVLRRAPRHVPRKLIWRLMFGDELAQSAWYIAMLLMGFAFMYLLATDRGNVDYDRQAVTRTMDVKETDWKPEGGRKIYRVAYTFLDESGAARHGESFTTGAPAGPGPWTVDYRSDDPSESQLRGMRRRPRSWTWLMLSFPIGALAIAFWELRTALRNLRLLRHGTQTTGTRVHQREAYWFRERIAVFTFQYEVDDKTYSTTVKTKRPVVLNDDRREPMLYDPKLPSRATTLDHLPGSPRITASGEVEGRAGTVIHLLISPVLFVGFLVATATQMI